MVHGVWFDAAWQVPPAILDAAERNDVPCRALAPGGIERIASTTTPQPVVAEVELPANARALHTANAVVALVDVSDPGNVGTLARSVEAAGFDGLVVLGQTADPFGPKAVRASAGAILRVNIFEFADAKQGLDELAAAGLERLGTRMDNAEMCDTADLCGRLAVVLGSEAHGLGSAVEGVDRWIAIPMAGSVESLNVAMAGTVLTYEIGRQRRQRQQR